MNKEVQSLNIYQKLLKITEEVGKIEKTGKNQQQGYAFTEHSQVVAEVRVRLAEYGVMVIAETVSRSVEQFVSAKGTTTFHANVVSRYTIVNADKPEERIVCEWDAGEALDTSDKATSKATTASQKYFLMKLFHISDKDDPDLESYEVQQHREEEQSRQHTNPRAIDDIKVMLVDKGITEPDDQKRLIKILSGGQPLNTSGIARIKKEITLAMPDTLQEVLNNETTN